MSNFTNTLDQRLYHREVAQAALTAITTVGTIEQRVAMRTTFRTVFNVESIAVSGDDELYQFAVQLSNDDFTTVENAVILELGASGARLSSAPDSAIGEYELIWSTEYGGKGYKDARIRLVPAGAAPSIALSAHTHILGDV